LDRAQKQRRALLEDLEKVDKELSELSQALGARK
jgi:hypothetical protein